MTKPDINTNIIIFTNYLLVETGNQTRFCVAIISYIRSYKIKKKKFNNKSKNIVLSKMSFCYEFLHKNIFLNYYYQGL